MVLFFFCKQKTAYDLRISDWSSDVCSSDLMPPVASKKSHWPDAYWVSLGVNNACLRASSWMYSTFGLAAISRINASAPARPSLRPALMTSASTDNRRRDCTDIARDLLTRDSDCTRLAELLYSARSEEHTSELQSLMRNSYAVLCLQKTKAQTKY